MAILPVRIGEASLLVLGEREPGVQELRKGRVHNSALQIFR